MAINEQQLHSAFVRHDREVIVANVKLGCLIGVLLMPAGAVLDWMVYPPSEFPGVWESFLKLRFLCSFLIGLFWLVVAGSVGRKHPRPLGILLAMFPTFFIALMIYLQDGSQSLYYAGLNLVLLVIGFVLHWTLVESAIAVSLVLVMYVCACVFHDGPFLWKEFGNNMYFLTLTGIIVMWGSFIHSRWRFRDFTAQFRLEANKQELQASNEALEQALVDLKAAQDQLVQKGKEELMGQVSSGIVHDVGNLLAPVGNYLFKLKKVADTLPEDKRANFLETLVKIEKPMNAARGVLGTLQRYAHSAPQMSHECPLHGLMEDALNLVRPKCEEAGIQIKCLVDRQFIVIGQPLDLTMVFKNLLDNAIDATKVKAHVNEVPTIWVESRLEAQRGFLIFRDNGVGMKPEVLSNLFKPYKTTKGEGNGTGLGLVTCMGTVSRHGGKITVRSEPNEFTEFTVELPRHTTT